MIILCDSDLMFLYDLLNNKIDSPELVSMVDFHTSVINIRRNRLFNVQICSNNYSLASNFLQILTLANKIANFVDSFLYVS